MPFISSDDDDFRVFAIDRDVLVELQKQAELRGYSTRWSSVEQLLTQVGPGSVLMQSLLREERNGDVHGYRCLAIFPFPDEHMGRGITTFDIHPEDYRALTGVDLNSEGRALMVRMFSIALSGVTTVAKQ